MTEMHEMATFSRVAHLIGSEGLKKLTKGRVAIFGAGAVGSFTAENLARCGIGELTLVDFDVITPGNINRQLAALHSTIGQKKIDALSLRLNDINPQLKINQFPTFIDASTLPALLEQPYDYVVDAIDSFTPKLNLIKYCIEHGVSTISSMGAAGRMNPIKIKIGWLSQTTGCPLAKRLKKFLRRLDINFENMLTVYSTEVPQKPVSPGSMPTEASFQRGRIRNINGSISFIPAIFGCIIAGVVVHAIVEGERIPEFVKELFSNQDKPESKRKIYK